MKTRRRWPAVLAVAFVAFATAALVFHARLPRLMLDRFHRETARIGEDYRGLAAGVDVDLLARRYRLRDVRVVRRDGKIATPLVTFKTVDVALEPLARRSAVRVDGVRMHLIGGPGAPTQLGGNVPWRRLLEALAPGMPVQRIDFEDTGLHFHQARQPTLAITLDNLHGTIEDLATDTAHFQAQGLLVAHAPLRIDATFDPQGPPEALRLRARAHEVELPKLNAFARRWARLDFDEGDGEFALALDWKAPRVRGAVAMSLTDVDVFDLRQDAGAGGVLRALRELFAGAAAALEKDPETGRIEREFVIDARVEPLPQDNFEALRTLLEAAFADLGRYLSR